MKKPDKKPETVLVLPPPLKKKGGVEIVRRGLRPFFLWATRPEYDKNWTTVYYGAKGSCKSIHQAKQMRKLLLYLDQYYLAHPELNESIIFTNQKMNEHLESHYLGRRLYYWNDLDEIENCPRTNCWRAKKGKTHRLHGAYLFFDDIASIMPAGNYKLPNWMLKLFSQARHNSIHVCANLQDPFACHINFRRYIDVAYKFTKVLGTKDPDETKKPLKRIWGIYRRRKIDAESLWRYGDLPEETIRQLLNARNEENERLKAAGKEMDIVYSETWFGTYHTFGRKSAEIYDTLQDVEKYEPKGYIHKEFKCLDPHCAFRHVSHELV